MSSDVDSSIINEPERPELIFSKKGQRILSQFFAEEMLYEYVTGEIDIDRKIALERSLAFSVELRKKLSQIKMGLDYLDQIKKIEVEESWIKDLSSPTSHLVTLWERLKIEQWHSGIRLGIEATAVSLAIVGIALFIPWQRLIEIKFSGSESVVISEVANDDKVAMSTETEIALHTPETPIADEGENSVIAKEQKEITQAQATNAQPAVVEPSANQKLISNSEVSKTEKAPVSSASPIPTEAQSAQAAETALVANTEGKKVQGFLFRGTVEITNIEAVTPKLISKITELGGRKAGEVPLGWKKGTGYYFHFTIPDSKYANLVEFFDEYGKMKIQKEAHGKVMPDGIIRLIIQANEAAKPKAPTPPKVQDVPPNEPDVPPTVPDPASVQPEEINNNPE